MLTAKQARKTVNETRKIHIKKLIKKIHRKIKKQASNGFSFYEHEVYREWIPDIENKFTKLGYTVSVNTSGFIDTIPEFSFMSFKWRSK